MDYEASGVSTWKGGQQRSTLSQESPMRSNVTTGLVAGLIAGVVFGIMMTVMHAPTPEGGSMPMMAMVAMVVKSKSLVVGWLYHLVNCAVIGGLFGTGAGALVGDQLEAQDQRVQEQQRQIEESQRELERQRQELERLKKQQEY
jgi:hypothetical protein